jgi:hypothetical protein
MSNAFLYDVTTALILTGKGNFSVPLWYGINIMVEFIIE